MSERTFDRETILDLMVNVIPLVIILFFVAVFLVVRPWGPNFYMEFISMGLLVIPFVALAAFTYFSGRIISRDEERDEKRAARTLDNVEAEMDSRDGSDESDDYAMVEDTIGDGDGNGTDH